MRPTSTRNETFAPSVVFVETTAEPSAFMRTTAQLPSFGFHSSVCVPVPETLCSQIPTLPGAAGRAVPECGVVSSRNGSPSMSVTCS